MSVDLQELEQSFYSALAELQTSEAVETLEADYLGKKGKLKKVL